jgi:hypothetical protein
MRVAGPRMWRLSESDLFCLPGLVNRDDRAGRADGHSAAAGCELSTTFQTAYSDSCEGISCELSLLLVKEFPS